ncbi:MAG: thiol-disulfide isomerase/thioredoxin [Flavobacteriaceae bacterium]|jgi:thiol-disulfide isomerase/thioredoxin|uniref:T9SS type A sorting domain-containing protein n=1 Tax=Candidatus Marifrigoribacter sp. Uisw_064 TaxID=3230970 RepID=UPI003AE06C28
MKKITSLLLLMTISIASFAQINNYNVGDTVDDFTVTDVFGVVHNLNTYAEAGQYIYLDFFFDTCGPCQVTQPIFNEFFDKYGCNEGDLVMISINNGSDTDQEVIDFEEQYGGPFNHAPAVSADGGAGAVDSNFGVAAYPTYCLVGPDRTLLVNDIWPIAGVQTYESALPAGVDPEVMVCSLGVLDNDNVEFSIFPTISNGQNITVELVTQIAKNITVFDVTGKLVYSNNESSNQVTINLSVNSGVYFVQVNTDTSSSTKKIIIK